MIMKKALFFLQVSNNSNIDQRKLLDYILLNQINQAIIFDVFKTNLASFKKGALDFFKCFLIAQYLAQSLRSSR